MQRLILLALPAAMLFACAPKKELPPISASALKDVQLKVSQIRGLKFLKPVEVGWKTEKEVRAFLEERISEEYTPEDIEHERTVLYLLGLLPNDFPYKERFLGLLTGEIVAYYDPKTEKLWLTEKAKVGSGLFDAVLAHEVTHALQDQHFDLGKRLERGKKDNDDEVTAIQALAEGEAVEVMRESGGNLADGLEAPTETPKDIPPFMMASLIFPYIQGAMFVQALKGRGNWEAVNRTWRSPPKSTEEIIHPGKPYDAMDIGTDAFREKGLGEMLDTNVMGELGIRLVLGHHLDPGETERAGDGWGGDRWWLYLDPVSRKTTLHWLTNWDSGKDAEEFERAAKKIQPGHEINVKRDRNRVTIQIVTAALKV